MAQAQQLIDTLKHTLKVHKKGYADVARDWDLSEANVKRLVHLNIEIAGNV